MSGWFSVKHGIRKHPIFKGRPDRLGAWIAMLDEAAWADTRQNIGGEIITVARGELCASQAMLEEITGMTRKQLRGFLDLLKAEGAIRTRPGQKGAKSRAIITFCNYDKYQEVGAKEGPKKGQERAKEGPTKEQDKQINNIPTSSGGADAQPVDAAGVIFSSGLKLLMASGKSSGASRGILGKWRRDHGDEAVVAALGRAQREGAIDPVAFVEGCFRFQKRAAPKWEKGDIRTLSPTKVQMFWDGHWENTSDYSADEAERHPRFVGRAPAYAEA